MKFNIFIVLSDDSLYQDFEKMELSVCDMEKYSRFFSICIERTEVLYRKVNAYDLHKSNLLWVNCIMMAEGVALCSHYYKNIHKNFKKLCTR